MGFALSLITEEFFSDLGCKDAYMTGLYNDFKSLSTCGGLGAGRSRFEITNFRSIILIARAG